MGAGLVMEIDVDKNAGTSLCRKLSVESGEIRWSSRGGGSDGANGWFAELGFEPANGSSLH